MSDASVLDDPDEIRRFLDSPSRVAVIGMKREGAARSVPEYLAERGFEVLPVNPKYDKLAGREAVDRVDEIDEPVEIVDIFRRSEVLPGHVDEILAMESPPDLVWFQLGIRNDGAAQRLVDAGISVVQDRCIKVQHAHLVGDDS